MAHRALETPVKNRSIIVEQIVMLPVGHISIRIVVYGMNFSVPLK